jgi:signal transduction histidine kinase
LAHELRTPLGAIATAAEIMMDERFGPVGDKRYAAYVAGIHESALHAIRIVERALADKPPRPADGSEAGDVDVNATLENVALQVRPLAESAGLELALDLAASSPHVAADPTSLRQIVINLLTNALKFTNAGGRVRVSSAVACDGELIISVEDSGSGMSRAEITEIMKLGDAPAPKPRAGGGLGLGLPLVRALAEANGASLTLESEPGRGTKAKIVFAGNRTRSG